MKTTSTVRGKLSALATAILALMLTSAAHAGTILQPTNATTTMGSVNSQYLPTNAINQSDLSATYVSGVTDFDLFTATTHTLNGGSGFTGWYSQVGTTIGNFDFALGGPYTIESFALWADPQLAGQGVKNFNLYAANNPAFTSPTLLGGFVAFDGHANITNFAQVFTFAPTSASYVRMEILSNNGSSSFSGIMEGAFEIPEPSTLAIIIAGGLVVAAVRRRMVA